MKNLQLYIDNQLVDYYDSTDASPKIYKRFFNIGNIDQKSGDYTLTISLPKTQNNFKIFNYFGELNIDNINFYRNYKAIIVVDSITIFTGTFIINSITNNNIKGYIIGDNIDWKLELENKSLRDIQSFEKTAFIGTRDTWAVKPVDYKILQDFITSVRMNDTEADFQVPLVSYGNYNTPNGYSLKIVNVTNPNLVLADGIYYQEINTPDAYIKPVIQITVQTNLIVNAFILKEGLDFQQKDPILNYNFNGATLDLFFYQFDKLNQIAYPLEFEDYIPSCSLYKTIKYIFEDARFDLELNMPANDIEEFKKIIIPYVGGNQPGWNWGLLAQAKYIFRPHYTAVPSDNIFGFTLLDATFYNLEEGNVNNVNYSNVLRHCTRPTLAVNLSSTNVPYDYSLNQFIEGGQVYYKAPVDGEYTFNVRLPVGNIFRSGGTNLLSYINKRVRLYFAKCKTRSETFTGTSGVGLFEDTYNPSLIDSNVIDYTDYYFNYQNSPGIQADNTVMELSVTVNLTRGEYIYPGIASSYYSIDEPKLRLSTTINNGEVYFQCSGTSDDYLLNPAKFLPDITQLDLINNVTKLFNFYFTQEDNKIILSSYKNYFFPNETAIEWSDKVNQEDFELSFASNIKSYNFKMYRDDAALPYDYTKVDYSITNENKLKTEVKDIEVIFAPTPDRIYINEKTGIISEVDSLLLPTIASQDSILQLNNGQLFSFYSSVRLLKIQSFNNVRHNLVNYYGFESVQLTDYIYTTFDNYNGQQISFKDKNNNIGLVNRYWLKNISDIDNTYELKYAAMLESIDISNLDIRRPIKIGNNLFTIVLVDGFDPIAEITTKIIVYKR